MTKSLLSLFQLFVFTILCSNNIFAQSFHFNYTDGTNASYSLLDVRKINFDADVMNLYLWDGSVFNWNVSTIEHYEFDEPIVNMEELLISANSFDLKLFPNPTGSYLNISFHLPQSDQIFIRFFDLQGNVLIEKKLGVLPSKYCIESLDLTHIPAGAYICCISGLNFAINKQVIKN